MATHRILVAAQPGAWRVLQPMLRDVAELVLVQTTKDAFKMLEGDGFDLILCTIAFDESRMIEFLQAVKRTDSGRIPFLSCRVVPGVLRDSLVHSMRDACKQCGAVDLVDIAKLPPERAQVALKAAVHACFEQAPPQHGP